MSEIETPNGQKLIDVLTAIRNETQPIDGHPDPGALDDCWNEVFETIERADQTEVQRLRAALEDILYQIQQSDHPAGLGILATINQALSTTDPTGAERVSLCMECDSETHQTEHCHVCGSKHIIPGYALKGASE